MRFDEYARNLDYLIEQRKIFPEYPDMMGLLKPDEISMPDIDKVLAKRHFNQLVSENKIRATEQPQGIDFEQSLKNRLNNPARGIPRGVNGIDYENEGLSLSRLFNREVEFRGEQRAHRESQAYYDEIINWQKNGGPVKKDRLEQWKEAVKWNKPENTSYAPNPEIREQERQWLERRQGIDGISETLERQARNRREREDSIFNRGGNPNGLTAARFREYFGPDSTNILDSPSLDRFIYNEQARLQRGREQYQSEAKNNRLLEDAVQQNQLQQRNNNFWKLNKQVGGNLVGDNFIWQRPQSVSQPITDPKFLLPGSGPQFYEGQPIKEVYRIKQQNQWLKGPNPNDSDFILQPPRNTEVDAILDRARELGRRTQPLDIYPISNPNFDQSFKNNVSPFKNRPQPTQIDPYSGSGNYGGNGWNRLPNGPQNPGGGLDIDQILQPRQSRPRNIIGTGINAFGVANGGGFGIPSMSGTTFADRPEIQAPTNLRLPGGRTPVLTTKNTGSPSSLPDRPHSNTGTYNGGNTATGNLQRFGNPFVRGVGVAGSAAELFQQAQLFGDAYNSLNDYRNTLDALGISPTERDRILREYSNPEYVNGLKKGINQATGARPFDALSVDFQYEALQALRRGENPQRFKERYFGPQNKDDAELYRMDYKNGPIFKPTADKWYGPFKFSGSDGYTDRQREGLNDARRRSVGSYYGPGIGSKLSQLGRQISSNFYNDYKQVLKNEKLKQKIQDDENKARRRYWDSPERFKYQPNQQRPQYVDPESLREWERPLDQQPVDFYERERESDLEKALDWNRRNPDYYKDAEYKRREKEIRFWLRNDPSKIGSKYDPFKPAPIPDPSNPPDPNYPPLPPGLRYPIWGWEIESYSSPGPGLTVPIYWYSSYLKDRSWTGDLPLPIVENWDGGSQIINEGCWQTGRVGLVVLDNLKFGSPPQFSGSDEREIITEAEGKEKWGEAWDYGWNDSRWISSPYRRFKEEILEDVRRTPYKGKSNLIFGRTTITKATPIRGKQPVPDTRPQNPPKPEPDEPIMPGCSYQPDKQNPAIVSWWDKLTNSIKQKPIQVHEGVDEGFTHVSKQMAEIQQQLDKISKVLDVEQYSAPQGKVVAPVLGMEAIQAVLAGSHIKAPIPLVKTLQQENMIFSAINYMLSGFHMLGKTTFPHDITKPGGDLARPTTMLSHSQWQFNQITNLIGIPNKQVTVNDKGLKTDAVFKNQADAIETVNAQAVEIKQDISGLEEFVKNIAQQNEQLTQMVFQLGKDVECLMKDAGFKTKQEAVQRPSVFTHGKVADRGTPGKKEDDFSWAKTFELSKPWCVVRVWDDKVDKAQLGNKIHMEAQKAALSNFYPISKNAAYIPTLRSKAAKTVEENDWRKWVKTSEDPGPMRQDGYSPVPDIEEIKLGVSKEINTADVTGRIGD